MPSTLENETDPAVNEPINITFYGAEGRALLLRYCNRALFPDEGIHGKLISSDLFSRTSCLASFCLSYFSKRLRWGCCICRSMEKNSTNPYGPSEQQDTSCFHWSMVGCKDVYQVYTAIESYTWRIKYHNRYQRTLQSENSVKMLVIIWSYPVKILHFTKKLKPREGRMCLKSPAGEWQEPPWGLGLRRVARKTD